MEILLFMIIKCDICEHEFDLKDAGKCDCGYGCGGGMAKCPVCGCHTDLPEEIREAHKQEYDKHTVFARMESKLEQIEKKEKWGLKKQLHEILDNTEKHKALVLPITTVNLQSYRQKENTHFPQTHQNPNLMAHQALAANKYSGIEGVNLPFDVTMEAEAFGCKVDLRDDNNMPEVIDSPFKSPDKIKIPDNYPNTERIQILFKAIKIIKDEKPDLPLIIGVVGPFTLLGQLLGIENLLKYLKTEYFQIEEALTTVTEALLKFTEKLDEAQVDIICVCEPSCSCDLLDPSIFRSLVKPELEYMADEIKTRTTLHVCGNTNDIIEDMLTCNFNSISIEDAVNTDHLKKVRKITNSPTKVCGNISTKTLLLGSPNDIKAEVRNALESGFDIITSSCSVPQHTPEENVKAMIKARDEYYIKREKI